MNPIYAWIIAYAAPALIAGVVVKSLPSPAKRPNPRNAVITHATLLLSGFLGQYFLLAAGYSFPWFPGLYSVLPYVLAVFLSFALIGKNGILYAISAFIQQFSMLSISFLLLQSFPWYLVALFIVPLFVWCHTAEAENVFLRITLFSLWGVLSVYLFHLFLDIYIVAALHAVLGSMLIAKKILYPQKQHES